MLYPRHAIPLAVAVIASLAASQGIAAPVGAGPFAGMAGSWSGVGAITMANGGQEGLRCRANYDVGGRGSQMRLSLRCASDSYKFDLGGEVESDGRTVTGSWSEAAHNADGTVTGRVNGDRIEVMARGGTFSARLSLVTRGKRQSVAIRPQGTEVSEVAITLAKGAPTTTGSAR
jgi:hypothetical protein